MKPDALSMASAIRKKKKPELSQDDGASEMAKSILAKKMSKGGMVDREDDDFLSDMDRSSKSESLTYPDDDGMEGTEGMGEVEDAAAKKKGMLRNIMASIRMSK